MNTVAPLFQLMVQVLGVLAWPLIVFFLILLERRRITRLMEALIALLGRVRSAKLTREGVTLELFAPEEVRLPDQVKEHQLDGSVTRERR
jgi:hypothetical protein